MADHETPSVPVYPAWLRFTAETLRTFGVVLRDGTIRRIQAHYWEDDNPGGHAHFHILTSAGRDITAYSQPNGSFDFISEITPNAVQDAIDELVSLRKMTPASKRVQ